MNRKLFSSALIITLLLSSTGLSFAGKPFGGNRKKLKWPTNALFVPEKLGKIKLSHDGKNFHAKRNGKRTQVQNCWVDKPLRQASQKHLAKLMESGYISVNELDDGELTLKANVRGEGGGPILGGILYGATKGVIYGGHAAGCFFLPGVFLPLTGPVYATAEITATSVGALGSLAPTP